MLSFIYGIGPRPRYLANASPSPWPITTRPRSNTVCRHVSSSGRELLFQFLLRWMIDRSVPMVVPAVLRAESA